jgi:hypothetical protein
VLVGITLIYLKAHYSGYKGIIKEEAPSLPWCFFFYKINILPGK